MDPGHAETAKKLQELENKINVNYSAAQKQVEKRLNKELAGFKKTDKAKLKALKAGKLTQGEYDEWRKKALDIQLFRGDLVATLASDLSNANKISVSLVNNEMPDVYALNANYGSYEIDKLTGAMVSESFSLYDHDTVNRLMRRNPEIMPKPGLNVPKDLRWNRRKVHSAMMQGILAGDSIPHIADKLQKVTDMNRNAAIRNARTYTTAAENGGRVDSYQRAKSMGINIKQEWMATLDMRTRTSHVHLDGEKVEVGKKFSNGCRYPGDPEGRPEEIYNCRCTLVAADPEFSEEDKAMINNRWSKLPDGMTYEDWKNRKTAGNGRKQKKAKRKTKN